MIVYTDSNGCIKDVGSTSDDSLIPVEILDDEENPFIGWNDAKICCYRVEVTDGHVTMLTPYVDTRLIPFIEKYGTQITENTSDIADNREGIMETFEATEGNASELADLRAAIEEVYEMISEE